MQLGGETVGSGPLWGVTRRQTPVHAASNKATAFGPAEASGGRAAACLAAFAASIRSSARRSRTREGARAKIGRSRTHSSLDAVQPTLAAQYAAPILPSTVHPTARRFGGCLTSARYCRRTPRCFSGTVTSATCNSA